MMKPKNSNSDKTQKLKLWQNSKTQIGTKLKKIKLWQNLICDNNSNCDKTQIVTKLKTQILTKLKNSICDKTLNSNCGKTSIRTNLNLWQKNT